MGDLALELGHACLQLRHGGADVGQLDDVGLRLLAQLTQRREVVGHALVLVQPLGKGGDHARGNADVADFHIHARGAWEICFDLCVCLVTCSCLFLFLFVLRSSYAVYMSLRRSKVTNRYTWVTDW